MYSTPKNKFRDILNASNYEETKNYRGSNQLEKDFPNTINPLVTKLPHDPKYQKDIQNREILKECWKKAHETSSGWLDSIPKVFWLGWIQDLDFEMLSLEVEAFLERTHILRLDEFSTIGYPNGIGIVDGGNGAFGFILKGKATYAVERDAWSQEGWRVSPEIRKWYHENRGGMPRHPMARAVRDLVRQVVFEAEDLGPESNIVGEIIIKDWEVTGMVVNEGVVFSILDLDWRYNQETIDWVKNLEHLYPTLNIIRLRR